METAVYKTHKFNLTVTNPLTKGGTFKIVLVESKGLKEGLKDRKKAQHSASSTSSIGSFDPTLVPVPTNAPCAFWCKDTLVELAPRGSATLDMEFLPLSPGPRSCALLFSCPGAGEFLQVNKSQGFLF